MSSRPPRASVRYMRTGSSLARRIASQSGAQGMRRASLAMSRRGQGVSIPAILRANIPEKKAVDVPTTQVTMSTTATFTLVNGIQEGSSFNNRVGRKVMMRSLHLNGQIASTGLGAGVSDYDRIMVVYDRQPGPAAPAIADLLLATDNAGGVTTTSKDGINMNNAERFAVLADIKFTSPDNAAGAAASADRLACLDYTNNQVNVNRFIKLKNLETHFKGTSNPAVIGDISTGSLWVVTFGNVAAASAGYAFSFTTRLRYHDQ